MIINFIIFIMTIIIFRFILRPVFTSTTTIRLKIRFGFFKGWLEELSACLLYFKSGLGYFLGHVLFVMGFGTWLGWTHDTFNDFIIALSLKFPGLSH